VIDRPVKIRRRSSIALGLRCLLFGYDTKFFVPSFITVAIFKLESMFGAACWIEAWLQPSSMLEGALLEANGVYRKTIGLAIDLSLHQMRRRGFASSIGEVLFLLHFDRHYMCLQWILGRDGQLSLLRESYGRDREQQKQG
jgi:hypothetical protein